MEKTIKFIGVIFALLTISIWVCVFVDKLQKHTTQTPEERVQSIYQKLLVQTGRSGDIPPVSLIDSDEINAYANSDGITVTKGMVNAVKNDDELALVIGHEIAHVTLGHTDKHAPRSDNLQSVLESQADKMGALYMIKAGYNICVGREFWNRIKSLDGDYINKDHPDMAYRYDQLDVNCSGRW